MADPEIWFAALQDLQKALQGMRLSAGHHWDIKPSSVVMEVQEPIDTIAKTELPYIIFGGLLTGPALEREFIDSDNSLVHDRLRFPLIARIDAEGTGRGRKLQAWSALVGDLEKLITKDRTRSHLAMDTLITSVDNMFIGLASQPIVLVQQEVVIDFGRRGYGDPSVTYEG